MPVAADIAEPGTGFPARAPAHPRSSRVLVVNPDAVLAGFALVGLVLIQMLLAKGALLFLVCGALIVARHPLIVAGNAARNWFVFVLPLFCTASALWSLYPELSLRYGVQLTISMGIGVALSARVPPRALLRALFVVMCFTAALCILKGRVRDDTGAMLGVFASKNAFAGAASLFAMVSAAMAIDRTARLVLRLAAFAATLLGLVLLIRAQSAGAIMMTFPVIGLTFLFPWIQRLSIPQRYVAGAFLALLAALVLLLGWTLRDELLRFILQTTGKDPTLTGRTELWAAAFDNIRERPLLGIGYQAFWVRGHSEAEALWRAFDIVGRRGFHFHNAVISNAVEIGVIGVALQLALVIGAVWVTFGWAIRSGRAEAIFSLAVTLQLALLSLVEVPFFFQFDERTVILVCVMLYGLRAREHHRAIVAAAEARRRSEKQDYRLPPLLLRP